MLGPMRHGSTARSRTEPGSWRQSHRNRGPRTMLPLTPSSVATARTLSLEDFAYLIAVGLGAVRSGNCSGEPLWMFDLRHKPPQGRLPMAFFARAVAAPAELDGGIDPIDARTVDAPQILGSEYDPIARIVLVFVEKSSTPILPHEVHWSRDGLGEQLYWRLVSTDSCEAVCCGALLTLRSLLAQRIPVCDEHGSPIVEFGMQNVVRVAPFTRHLMVSRVGCRVQRAPGAKPRVVFDEPPRSPSHGAVMHQVIWMRTAAGRQHVMDFTGPQYGVEDRLPATGTPFWRADVSESKVPHIVRGFELTGHTALFSGPDETGDGVLSNRMHAHIGTWIRDSALGVLAHRRQKRT